MTIAFYGLRRRFKADSSERIAGLQGRAPVSQANLALAGADRCIYGGQILFPARGWREHKATLQ